MKLSRCIQLPRSSAVRPSGDCLRRQLLCSVFFFCSHQQITASISARLVELIWPAFSTAPLSLASVECDTNESVQLAAAAVTAVKT